MIQGTRYKSSRYRLTVKDVIRETNDAVSIVLEPPADARDRFKYSAGQYLTLRIPSPGDSALARCYSLSSSPHADVEMAITVKRTAGGYGSNWLCDNARPGLVIESLPPAGRFSPRNVDADLVLVAGGSGISPILSILKSALHKGAGHIELLYFSRHRSGIILERVIADLLSEYPERLGVKHWISEIDGRISCEALRELLKPLMERSSFLCGPDALIERVLKAANEVGFRSEDLFVEQFFSLNQSVDAFANVGAAEQISLPRYSGALTASVTLAGEVVVLDWPSDVTLLDLLLSEGLPAPFSCKQGICSACYGVLKSGKVFMKRSDGLDEQELKEGKVLACQLLPISGGVEVNFDE